MRELLLTGPRDVEADLETLLAGGTHDERLGESIVLRNLTSRSDVLWSYLLFTGYLKAIEVSWVDGRQWCKLAVPNAEIALALANIAQEKTARKIPAQKTPARKTPAKSKPTPTKAKSKR